MLSFGVAMITELQFLAFCQVFICLSVWTDFVGMIASETQSKYLHARHSGKNFEECLKNAMVWAKCPGSREVPRTVSMNPEDH